MNDSLPITSGFQESNYWQSEESPLKTILSVAGALIYGYIIVSIAVLTVLGPVAAIIWSVFLGYDVEALNGILAALVFGGYFLMLAGVLIVGIWNLLQEPETHIRLIRAPR